MPLPTEPAVLNTVASVEETLSWSTPHHIRRKPRRLPPCLRQPRKSFSKTARIPRVLSRFEFQTGVLVSRQAGSGTARDDPVLLTGDGVSRTRCRAIPTLPPLDGPDGWLGLTPQLSRLSFRRLFIRCRWRARPDMDTNTPTAIVRR